MLYSVSNTSLRYFPPALSYGALAGSSYVFLLLLIASVDVVSITAAFPLDSPALPLFAFLLSLYLPPAPLPQPPLSLGILRPPAPPAHLLSLLQLPIFLVRKNMLLTKQAGVRHAGQLQAGPRRTRSDLTDLSPW